jgi:hypothetical protein
MVLSGLRGVNGQIAAPPYTKGPYTWDQQVTFTGGVAGLNTPNKIWYVDGNLSASGDGKSWAKAFITIQEGVDACSYGDVVYIAPKEMTDMTSDPSNYAENIIIPATAPQISLIGIGTGRVQGGIPQIKKSGTVRSYMLTIRAPGCRIENLGFNGNSTAGAPLNGAILLDSNASAKDASGTTIVGCHFKNCTGSTTTDGRTGGAIDWSANGVCWQVYIGNNRFYKNVCDICLLGTSISVPQDVVIENNIFSGPTASVDSQLILKGGGGGMNGVFVRNNVFPCLGTLGSAVLKRMVDMTGCIGVFSGNMCGSAAGATGFKAAGATAFIPAEVFMAGNWAEAALIVREA